MDSELEQRSQLGPRRDLETRSPARQRLENCGLRVALHGIEDAKTGQRRSQGRQVRNEAIELEMKEGCRMVRNVDIDGRSEALVLQFAECGDRLHEFVITTDLCVDLGQP